MNKKIFYICFFSLFLNFVYAQEVSANEEEQSVDKKEVEEKQGDVEEKKALILYGLETDLINLIKELKEKEDDRFNEELISVFAKARSVALKTSIIDFFASRHTSSINENILKMLENLDDYKNNEINVSLYYVGENKVKEAIPYLLSIIENERLEFIEGTINALGKIGGENEALALVSFYQDIAVDDEKKEVIFKEAIMRALENIAFSDCLDFLIEVIEDENENVVVRSLAVSALSNIKTDTVFDKLVALYSSQDPLIRASSIKAIAKFDSDEAKKLITEACKDSQYKVRFEAINAVNFSSNDVCEYLLYRAKTDPEMSIKTLSIEKLISLNCELANDWLLKTFNDDNASTAIRIKIAKELLENRLELIIKDVERVAIEAVSSDKYKKFSYELGRVIAKVKTDATSRIA
ncbi:MAG: HEAT repeat domain-containing protein [Treponema sp.]